MRSRGFASRAKRALRRLDYVCQSLTLAGAPSSALLAARDYLEHLGDTMAVLSLDQAARLTELGKVTITRAIKSCWHSACRKADGNYEIDPVEPEPSARRSHALIPWRAARLADLRADDELRHRLALAEEKLTDLKAALEDMRAQRDAWQAMAQARIRPAPASSTSRWPWLRATG
jgi:hypothetical protein